jgi:hypothetical protein
MKTNKRELLKVLSLGGSSISLVALPSKWVSPVVQSVILPAHAVTTDDPDSVEPDDPENPVEQPVAPNLLCDDVYSTTSEQFDGVDRDLGILYDCETGQCSVEVATWTAGGGGRPANMLVGFDLDPDTSDDIPVLLWDSIGVGSNWEQIVGDFTPGQSDIEPGNHRALFSSAVCPGVSVSIQFTTAIEFTGERQPPGSPSDSRIEELTVSNISIARRP